MNKDGVTREYYIDLEKYGSRNSPLTRQYSVSMLITTFGIRGWSVEEIHSIHVKTRKIATETVIPIVPYEEIKELDACGLCR